MEEDDAEELHVKEFSNNTPGVCIDYCHSDGYAYAAVRYGLECFCLEEPPPEDWISPDYECRRACAGDSHQICGGDWTMNVFSTG